MSAPTPAKKTDEKVAAHKVETVYVIAAHGKFLHLHTNVWFTSDPKKVEMDDFLRAQIDAGKLTVVPA